MTDNCSVELQARPWLGSTAHAPRTAMKSGLMDSSPRVRQGEDKPHTRAGVILHYPMLAVRQRGFSHVYM